MLAAPEISYALLLASGAANVEPVPVDQAAIILPISTETFQATGQVAGQVTGPMDEPVVDETGPAPTEQAEPETAPPYINAQPVIDSGPASFELSDGTGPEPEGDNSGDTLSGDIIVVTAPQEVAGDPLAGINLETFEIAQKVDAALVEPVVEVYESVLPEPVRDGLDNFTTNLNEPVNFFNFLLQGKFGKAAETLGRFVINSTIGVGGILDVAKREPFNLPYRYNGFANTLGFYGVEPGAYLYLPIVGSTTVRDLVGDGLDTLFMPTLVGKPFNRPTFTTPVFGIRAVNRRANFEECYDNYVEDSPDPYGSNRDLYLAQRQQAIDILRNRIPDPLSEGGDGDLCVDVEGDDWDEEGEIAEQADAAATETGTDSNAAPAVSEPEISG